MEKVYLLSTVVAPSFNSCHIKIERLTENEFIAKIHRVTVNLCGHQATNALLKSVCPTLPEPQRGFWQGDGIALAARPKGGVRGAAANGDTPVKMEDLEFCQFIYIPVS